MRKAPLFLGIVMFVIGIASWGYFEFLTTGGRFSKLGGIGFAVVGVFLIIGASILKPRGAPWPSSSPQRGQLAESYEDKYARAERFKNLYGRYPTPDELETPGEVLQKLVKTIVVIVIFFFVLFYVIAPLLGG